MLFTLDTCQTDVAYSIDRQIYAVASIEHQTYIFTALTIKPTLLTVLTHLTIRHMFFTLDTYQTDVVYSIDHQMYVIYSIAPLNLYYLLNE